MSARATLAAMHAARLLEARRLEAAAARRAEDDPAAMQAMDQAAEARAEAAALAEVLEEIGAVLPNTDPRQLALLHIPEEQDA